MIGAPENGDAGFLELFEEDGDGVDLLRPFRVQGGARREDVAELFVEELALHTGEAGGVAVGLAGEGDGFVGGGWDGVPADADERAHAVLADGFLHDVGAGEVGVGVAGLGVAHVDREDGGVFAGEIGGEAGIAVFDIGVVVLSGEHVLAGEIVEELEERAGFGEGVGSDGFGVGGAKRSRGERN